MKKIFYFLGLLACLPVSGQSLFESAQADLKDTQMASGVLGGFIRSSVYLANNADNDRYGFQSTYAQFGLTADLELGKYGKTYTDLRFRYGNEFNTELSELDLREAYAELFIGPLSIRMGKQIRSWGGSSFFNPSDQFSPLNPLYRSPDPDDMKIGQWSLYSNIFIGSSSSLELFCLPVYTPSVLITEAFSFPGYLDFTEAAWPDPEIRNSSFGVLYDLRSAILDASLSYYNGYRKDTRFSLSSASFSNVTFEPESITLVREAYRIHSAGFNLSLPLGSYIFRNETAWLAPAEEDKGDYLPYPELAYAAEIEQNGNNVSLIGGYYGKYIISFEEAAADPGSFTGEFPGPENLFPEGVPVTQEMIDAAMDEQIAAFNRLYNYQLAEFYHQVYVVMTLRLLSETLEIELPLMYNFTTEEYLIHPGISYSVTDGLKVEAGYSFMKGPDKSIFKLAGSTLNAAYLSLKATF